MFNPGEYQVGNNTIYSISLTVFVDIILRNDNIYHCTILHLLNNLDSTYNLNYNSSNQSVYYIVTYEEKKII